MTIRHDCWLKDNCNHIDCDKFCIRNYKLGYLYEAALISDEQRRNIKLFTDSDGTDLKEFKRLAEIQKGIDAFVSHGDQLYLHSQTTGSGKTSWALKLCQTYLSHIWSTSKLECRVLFINTPKFLISLKDNISERNEYAAYIKENVLKADLVVWDDIAFTDKGTSFETAQLFSFIDSRISNRRANIYTSNVSPELLPERIGERLASRIGTGSLNIEFKGKDKRGLKYEQR